MDLLNIVLIFCCVFGLIALIASVVKHRRIQRQLREENARSAKASAEFWAEMNRKNAAHAERIYGLQRAKDQTMNAGQKMSNAWRPEPQRAIPVAPETGILNPLNPLSPLYQSHSYTAPEPSTHCEPSHSSSHDPSSSSHSCSGYSYDSGSSSSSSSSDCGSSSSSCD